MGYTHYWRLRPTVLPTEALILGELLGRAYHRGIIQREFDDPRPPFVSDTKIRFNGVGENGHETFCFTSTPEGGQPATSRTFQFCKTARKPYDQVVMQVLIVLKHYLGKAITVTSDGDFSVEWAETRRELAQRYGIRTGNGHQLERGGRLSHVKRGLSTRSVLHLTHLLYEVGGDEGAALPWERR